MGEAGHVDIRHLQWLMGKLRFRWRNLMASQQEQCALLGQVGPSCISPPGAVTPCAAGACPAFPAQVGCWPVRHRPRVARSLTLGLQFVQDGAQSRCGWASVGQGACRVHLPVARSPQRPPTQLLSRGDEMGSGPCEPCCWDLRWGGGALSRRILCRLPGGMQLLQGSSRPQRLSYRGTGVPPRPHAWSGLREGWVGGPGIPQCRALWCWRPHPASICPWQRAFVQLGSPGPLPLSRPAWALVRSSCEGPASQLAALPLQASLPGVPSLPPNPDSLCPCHWSHQTTEPVRGLFLPLREPGTC